VFEPVFRRPGRRIRPFCLSAVVVCRGCSLPFQRVVSVFGAVLPFAHVPFNLQVHYGFSLTSATFLRISNQHALHLYDKYKKIVTFPLSPGVAVFIVETVGCMFPFVSSVPALSVQRKGYTLSW